MSNSPKLVAEEAILFNDTNLLGAALWQRSTEIVGLNGDPKMVSIMLFRRLWSHHRGFALLFKDRLMIEADTLLRSTIEASICIAANAHLEGGLWGELKRDALHTVTRQIAQAREAEDKDLEREGEKMRRWLSDLLPKGVGGKKLEMKTLSEAGKVPMLYGFYRALSATSSHVSGLSIMRDVVGVDGEGQDLQHEWSEVTHRSHHLWQLAAVLQASFLHALMIEEQGHADAALAMAKRLEACLAKAGF